MAATPWGGTQQGQQIQRLLRDWPHVQGAKLQLHDGFDVHRLDLQLLWRVC